MRNLAIKERKLFKSSPIIIGILLTNFTIVAATIWTNSISYTNVYLLQYAEKTKNSWIHFNQATILPRTTQVLRSPSLATYRHGDVIVNKWCEVTLEWHEFSPLINDVTRVPRFVTRSLQRPYAFTCSERSNIAKSIDCKLVIVEFVVYWNV